MAILAFLPIIGELLDRVLPDPKAAADAKLELTKLAMSGELQTTLAQLDIDKTEASSASLFVAGWRPFVGWTCGSALAYNYILQPFLVYVADLFGKIVTPPSLSLADLLPVLFALLGLGGMRTVEVVKGAKPPDAT